jgi:hypothetical protein
MKSMMQKNKKRAFGSVGKRLFILLFSLGLAYGVSAQRGAVGHGYVGGGFHGAYHGAYHGYYHPYFAPRVYAPAFYGGWGFGLGLGWGLGWGVPGWYGPWAYPAAYPPYYYGRGPVPPALNDEISGIKSDYKAQIKDVKHDKALTHSDKEQKINELEQKRDAAITQARHDFFNARMRARYGDPERYNNNGQPQNNQAKPAPDSGGNSSNDTEHPEYSN